MCFQPRWHLQLTFLICEFTSIWTEVTQEHNPIWEIVFEIWLHMFTVGARSRLWSLMDQIGTGFHIFLSSFCLPASPFISCSSSVPSTSTFLCLSSPCSHVGRCSRAYSMCEWARSCRNMRVSAGRPCVRVAVVFASGRLPCRLPELHIKQAVLQGLSSSLDRTYQLGGGGGRVSE